MAGLFTYVSGSTFVFQDQFALDPQQFGYVFASGAVAITLASQVYGALVGRFRPEQILTWRSPQASCSRRPSWSSRSPAAGCCR